jgi:hypothetical protein
MSVLEKSPRNRWLPCHRGRDAKRLHYLRERSWRSPTAVRHKRRQYRARHQPSQHDGQLGATGPTDTDKNSAESRSRRRVALWRDDKIAAVVDLLIRREAAYISGASLRIDGGDFPV